MLKKINDYVPELINYNGCFETELNIHFQYLLKELDLTQPSNSDMTSTFLLVLILPWGLTCYSEFDCLNIPS